MLTLDAFKTIPVGSIMSREEGERPPLLIAVRQLPPGLTTMITSPRTGAFLRGLTKMHDLPEQQAVIIAYDVLQTTLGLLSLRQLSQSLTSHLNVDGAIGLKIAQEIERELFVPYLQELNQLRLSSPQTSPPSVGGGARNVLDLKNQSAPPVPPPLPPRR